jgi:hypothetical protein
VEEKKIEKQIRKKRKGIKIAKSERLKVESEVKRKDVKNDENKRSIDEEDV